MKKTKYACSVLVRAKDHCIYNRYDLQRSIICGCYRCGTIFFAKEIRSFKDDDQTALCPFCNGDSLLDESSEYPLKKDFLKEMKRYWRE